jgi:hypothetical protein
MAEQSVRCCANSWDDRFCDQSTDRAGRLIGISVARIRKRPLRLRHRFSDLGQVAASMRALPATLLRHHPLIKIKARYGRKLDCLFSIRGASASEGERPWL